MRLEPDAIGALGARLAQRQRADVGDQRQDHHRDDGRGDPRAARGSGSCTTRPARTWPAGSPRPCSPPRARGGGSPASSACSRSTSCGSLALAAELQPRAILLGNLFRDQLDRYGELEPIAERWAARCSRARPARLVLNADDPLIADLGREHPDAVYFGVEDDSLALAGMAHAADAKHCRRCGAPYVFDAVYLGHLGHYHCPAAASRRPTPGGDRQRGALQGVRSASFTLRTPAGEARGLARRCPGSTTSTTRSPPPRSQARSRCPLDDHRRARRDARGVRARRERDPLPAGSGAHGAPRSCGSCSSRTRRAPTRCCARSRSSPASTTCSACSTTTSPTAATSPGSGTRTSSCWPGASGAVTCSGTRAADLALRLKYAGVDPRSHPRA